MVTNQTAASYSSLCDVIRDRAIDNFHQRALTIKSEMARRGVLVSSMHLQQTDKAAAEVLTEYARQIFDALMKAHAAEPIKDLTERTIHLQQLLSPKLTELGQALLDARDSTLQAASRGLSMNIELGETPKALRRVIAEYSAELQIAVTSIANSGDFRPAVNNTFNVGGNVGSIQTGDRSVAKVDQSIGGRELQEVLSSIESLCLLLNQATNVNHSERDETLKVLQEIRTELTKGKPNKSRLGGLLSGAATLIQTIPNATPAWTILLEWSRSIGVVVKSLL